VAKSIAARKKGRSARKKCLPQNMPIFSQNMPNSPPPPEGVHAARIVQAYRSVPFPGGEPRLTLTLALLPTGPTLKDSLGLSAKMRWKFVKLLGSAGLVVPSQPPGQHSAVVDFDEGVLTGRVCYVRFVRASGRKEHMVTEYLGRKQAIIENRSVARIDFTPQSPAREKGRPEGRPLSTI
jgi:hypothetical protein